MPLVSEPADVRVGLRGDGVAGGPVSAAEGVAQIEAHIIPDRFILTHLERPEGVLRGAEKDRGAGHGWIPFYVLNLGQMRRNATEYHRAATMTIAIEIRVGPQPDSAAARSIMSTKITAMGMPTMR